MNSPVYSTPPCMLTVAAIDHSSDDSIAVGILSHGSHSGQVCGVDGQLVDVGGLLSPLKHCTSLAGKPKIIIIEVGWMFLFLHL